MKIGIIGATGSAGSAVHALALERAHETTAIVRSCQRAQEVLGAGSLATVILDEIENPRHRRERFTARDR